MNDVDGTKNMKRNIYKILLKISVSYNLVYFLLLFMHVQYICLTS